MAARGLEGWLVGREIRAATGPGGLVVDVGDARYPGLVLGAGGRFQQENLTVAIAAAQRFLGRPLAPDGVREVAAHVRVPGRLEVFDGSPRIVIDGAHNPAGMHALAGSLGDVFRGVRPVAVVSVLGDKDVAGMLAPLLPQLRRAHRHALEPSARRRPVRARAHRAGAGRRVRGGRRSPRGPPARRRRWRARAAASWSAARSTCSRDLRPGLVAARPSG